MSNPTTDDISADTGEIYDAVDGGETAVESMLDKAKNRIKRITGTTTGDGQDDAIRDLCNMFVCNQVMGGIDPISKNIAGINVGEKKLVEMRDRFKEDVVDTLKQMGYSLTGNHIIFKSANQ